MAVRRVALAERAAVGPGPERGRARPGPAALGQDRPLRGHEAALRPRQRHARRDRSRRPPTGPRGPAAPRHLAAVRYRRAIRRGGDADAGQFAADRRAAIRAGGRERPGAILRDAGTGHEPALSISAGKWASTAPAATCPSSRPTTSWPSTSTWSTARRCAERRPGGVRRGPRPHNRGASRTSFRPRTM